MGREVEGEDGRVVKLWDIFAFTIHIICSIHFITAHVFGGAKQLMLSVCLLSGICPVKTIEISGLNDC